LDLSLPMECGRETRLVEASTIGTQQAAKACQDLSDLTGNMRNLVERFHLSRDQASRAQRTSPWAGLGGASQDVGGGWVQ
jgi:hypothetical protein